jgi:hypothetical protein
VSGSCNHPRINRAVRGDSGELDEGQAGRFSNPAFAHLSRRGCWFYPAASLMPSTDGWDDMSDPNTGVCAQPSHAWLYKRSVR